MALSLRVLASGQYIPNQANSLAYLEYDNWDDFGYKTLFSLVVFDDLGNQHHIGNLKIGFIGQQEGKTIDGLRGFAGNALPDNFYSLGQDSDYYQKK